MAPLTLADTGFFLALLDRSDPWHSRAVDALKQERNPLVTTWPVLTETCFLLLRRMGHPVLARFLESGAQGAYEVHELRSSHLPRMRALMDEYRELPMDLADCSLVILAEELGHGRILTTDARDFGAYRWKSRKPFVNVMERR